MLDSDPTRVAPVDATGAPSDEMGNDPKSTDEGLTGPHSGPLGGSLEQLTDRVARLAAMAPEDRAVPEHSLSDDYDALALATLEAKRAATWRRSIPQRYHRADLCDLDSSMTSADLDAISGWSRDHGGRNLVVLGSIGAGKTHAAIAACRAAHMDRGMDVRFFPAPELMDLLRPGQEDLSMGDLVDIDLLIVDDLDTVRGSEWTDERLYLLINRRWMEEMPTITTSNLSANDLQSALGRRTFSRLAGSGAVVIEATGNDRRFT